MESKLWSILQNYDISVNEETDVHPFGDGHINDTYMINSEPKYILQRIKTSIFREPEKLMENISAVCDALYRKLGGKPDSEPLRLALTKDGKTFYRTEDNEYYRVYYYIPSRSYNAVESPEQLSIVAGAFGKFQKELADFPAASLYETIPNFHNTPIRLDNLKTAIAKNAAGRAASVQKEIDFALSYGDRIHVVTDGIADGSIPLRVTHNDTKLNNILFSPDKDVCISVIDLDTVMPGSLLYDFGDALRFAASSAAEDETDLNRVWCRLDLFEAFTRGYLREMYGEITPRELELLPFSVLLMTYECGIRFLTDYLDGDVYFKIHHPDHNLERARNQLKLVADIDTKLSEMTRIVNEVASELAMQ